MRSYNFELWSHLNTFFISVSYKTKDISTSWEMVTQEDVVYVRHIVQGILVPCVVVIGLLGNAVSIVVLTRKRMRCTTNIYLTALAITDIIYLTMVFLLSLQHSETVHLHYKIYWQFYGLVIWLTDGCAYISIYIAVCFTIERFIAIRYPLKRQTFCTESLAKRVIAGVAIFCLLLTISTAFEHKAVSMQKLVDIDGKPCEVNLTKIQDIPNINQETLSTLDVTKNDSSSSEGYSYITNPCQNVTYHRDEYSNLGQNETYTNIFYILTSIIFVFIPLCILGTFNLILIILVRKSKHRRGEMTNASVRRSTIRKNSTVSQENRITVTLIAVVILFIVCQLPWAIYLIVSGVIRIENNLQNIIGNVFNLLAAINAALNFFLYCVLSDKYRKTVKELIVGYKYRRRNMSISTSYASSSRRYRPASQLRR